jgi:predicted glutamine amidotransferase
MCGIAGIKRYGNEPISLAEIETLICTNEVRGNHASGIAIQTGVDIVIHKMPLPAWNFVKDPATKGFLAEHLREETDTVLLHTRFATVGSPNKNENNHPMFDGRVALVHNGGIRNADYLFKEMELTRHAETDSDILRAIVAEHGFTAAAARQLARCTGSAAIAAVSIDYPDHLFLGRSGNPLVVAHANDKLYFASTLQAIQRAVRPWEKHHGLFMRGPSRNFSYSYMHDHTCYVLKPDDTADHHEMNIAGGTFTPVKYASHENYAEKMQVWQSAKSSHRVYAQCRECGTAQGKFTTQSWDKLKCRSCDTSFDYLVGVPVNA